MEFVDEGYRPVITCDWCQKLIEQATDGNYEYAIDERGLPRNEALIFTHKHCCQAFEEAHGGPGQWRMEDLQCLPLQLSDVMVLDWEEVRRQC